MTIHIRYKLPTINGEILEYFFRHIQAFEAVYDDVMQSDNLYNTPLFGASAVGLAGVFACQAKLTIGDLLRLYAENPYWKYVVDGVQYYRVRVAGSFLSGTNRCTVWNAETQRLFQSSTEKFGVTARQAIEVHRNPPTFNKDKATPKNVHALFQPIWEMLEQLELAKALKQKQENFAKRRNEQSSNPIDKFGVSQLMRLCEVGDLKKIVRVLQQNPEALKHTAKDGRTIMNFAAKNLLAIRYIVKKIGFIECPLSPIVSACDVLPDLTERIKLLVQLGYDMNARCASIGNMTALEYAKENDPYPDVVEALISKGVLG